MAEGRFCELQAWPRSATSGLGGRWLSAKVGTGCSSCAAAWAVVSETRNSPGLEQWLVSTRKERLSRRLSILSALWLQFAGLRVEKFSTNARHKSWAVEGVLQMMEWKASDISGTIRYYSHCLWHSVWTSQMKLTVLLSLVFLRPPFLYCHFSFYCDRFKLAYCQIIKPCVCTSRALGACCFPAPVVKPINQY